MNSRWEIISPYRGDLIKYALRLGADRGFAEDIAHESLIRAYCSKVMAEERPWPYLATIVSNLLVDHRRRAARDAGYGLRRLLLPAQQHPIEDTAAARDLARRALRRLAETEPNNIVQMVLRRAVDGVAWTEVGAEFAVAGTTAQAAVRRALIRLGPWLRRRGGTEKDLA
jgi:DNA-directed RNA polymerase specialized sigma24 family protein